MKDSKIIIGFTLLIFVFVVFSSCATTKFSKEPDESITTLLVGQIRLETYGIPIGYELKGPYTSPIQIYLENMSTGEIAKLESKGSEGFFSMINPSAKSYRIQKIYLKAFGENYYAEFEFIISSEVILNINEGKVNNLGLIEWKYDYNYKRQYADNLNYEKTKIWFEEKYPESVWNKKEWVNIILW